MEVKLWSNFQKRRNSTKVPNTQPTDTKDVKLKGNCSIMNPSFFLADASLYSYLQWNGLYYFIDNVSWDINGASYVDCKLDYLGSWKTEILATTAFVAYSTNDYSTLLKDDRVATEVTMTCAVERKSSNYFQTIDDADALVVLGSISQAEGIVQYAMSKAYLDAVIYDLFQDDSVFDSLMQQFGAVSQGLIFAKRFPIDPDKISVMTPASLFIGNYELPGAVGKVITNLHLSEIIEITIPWHYTDFRKMEPYQRLSVTLPFIGETELSISDFLDTNTMDIRMDMSLVTGKLSYTIRSNGNVVSVLETTIGQDLPLATDQLSKRSIEGLMSASAEIGTGLGLAQGLAVAHGISSMVNAVMHAPQTSITVIGGYSGNYGEYAVDNYRVNVRYCDTRIDPSNLTNLYGRPCMKTRSLTGLTGYVQTQGFSIDIASTDMVRDLINKAMDSGVYLE